MLDLSTFQTWELPYFAAWLRNAEQYDKVREVLKEYQRRLDADLRRKKLEMHEEVMRMFEVFAD